MKEINHYLSMLEHGAISRREFMGRALALGVTVTGATAMLPRYAQAAPKKGGRLRYGLTGGASSDTIDPALLTTFTFNISSGQIRNCLTEIAADGGLIGELAESWEASPDAKVWTFKLRQGVEFHNGKTLTVTDVIESINYHRGEDSTSGAKATLSGVTDIKAGGKNEIVFTMGSGNADFPYLLAEYQLVICPAKAGGGIDWQSGIGTGGYVLDSFEPGVKALSHRNKNYWKEGHAHFDEIESLFIPDATARTTALQTGEIDVMTSVDLKTVNRLERVSGINIIKTTGNKHVTLPMHTNKSPYSDNNLRLALKHSIDREQWLKFIVKGYGEIGNDIPLGPANIYRASTDEIPQHSYDPDKARHYLKKAGYDSIDLQIWASDVAFEGGVIDAAQLYSETAKKSGINLEVVRHPADGYWSNVWGKKPFMCSYWNGRPTEDAIFSLVYSANEDGPSGWNDTLWSHDRFNELLLLARSELDTTVRRGQYLEMQRILHDEGGAIIPLFLSYVAAASDKVHLPDQMSANWELDGTKCTERWWFK